MEKNIYEDLQVLKKYYDSVRVVDPLVTKPVQLNNTVTALQYDPEPCFHFYQHDQRCKNCISLQATQYNDTFIKIELYEGNLVMIIAIPIQLEGNTLALEMTKRINNEALENLLKELNGSDIYSALNRLNRLTITDGLTRVYNRRYINEKLPIEIAHACLHNLPLSIVMTDIDDFKRVNEQYGHCVGDEVLKIFATQLKKTIRHTGGDWVARYGGDEFLIFLANCPEEQAYKIAEKLRSQIEHTAIPTAVGSLFITASFGVHTFHGNERDIQQVLNKVDKHLYQAKQAGRNCTM